MNHLLETKLFLPEPTSERVLRSRLCARLDRGLTSKLTLVCAPAGFGKTTVVANWLRHQREGSGADGIPARVGWFTIDEQDHDLGGFVSYVAAAIRAADPRLLSHWLDPAFRPQDPDAEALADELIHCLVDEIGASPGRLLLTLDDYHCVTDPAIHHFTSRLIRHLPPAIHLIVTSRFDPPLGIARLRAHGQLAELRAADLAFTLEEAGWLLQEAVGVEIEPDIVAAIWTRTEGWAAGLRLAAVSLQGGANHQEFVRSFAESNNRHIAAYLLDQVLALQPPGAQDFLLRTSILDRFCGTLCAEVLALPPSECEAMLGEFERYGLFLVTLDEHGEWYRYHGQFRTMLFHRLRLEQSASQMAALHIRAARWLAAQDRTDCTEAALRHFLAGGNPAGAADALARQIPNLLRRQLWRQSAQWLQMLPLGSVEARPDLLLLEAWVAYQNSNYRHVRELVARVEAMVTPTSAEPATPDAALAANAVLGQLLALRISSAFDDQSLDEIRACGEQALQLLPAEYDMVRGHVLGFLAQAALTGQGYAAAIHLLRDELQLADGYAREYTLQVLYAMGGRQYLAGQIDHLEFTSQQLADLAAELDVPTQVQWGRFGLGLVLYERGAAEAAVAQFAAVFACSDVALFQTLRLAAVPLLELYAARGEGTLGQAVLDILWQRLRITPVADEHREVEAIALYWQMLRGEPAAAARLIDAGLDVIRYEHVPSRDAILLAALHARGRPQDLAEAARLAATAREAYRALSDTRGEIRMLMLLVQTYWRQNLRAASLHALQEALALGYSRGWRRTLIAPPELMGEILHQLAHAREYAAVAGSLLAVIAQTGASQPYTFTEEGSAAVDAPIEHLSNREREVLDLLAGNLSNKEIARALHISPLTVRNHTAKIYDKLQAENRRDAVSRARRLGLIPA
jgi:LuxR family maltose regulon positive regulatory protein